MDWNDLPAEIPNLLANSPSALKAAIPVVFPFAVLLLADVHYLALAVRKHRLIRRLALWLAFAVTLVLLIYAWRMARPSWFAEADPSPELAALLTWYSGKLLTYVAVISTVAVAVAWYFRNPPYALRTFTSIFAIGELVVLKSMESLEYRLMTLRLSVVAAACLLLVACIFWLPRLIVNRDLSASEQPQGVDLAKVRNDVRTTLLQGFAGVFLLLGAFFTWQQLQVSQQQLRNTLQGQRTDTYSRAIEQIGSGNLDVRLGGLTTLGRIARESRQDKFEIARILEAYIRHHSPRRPNNDGTRFVPLRLRLPDVELALNTLVGFNPESSDLEEPHLGWITFQPFDLRNTDLRGAQLCDALLSRSNLEGADLSGANLTDADLRSANLRGASLTRAVLYDADLSNAQLEAADMEGADLRSAHFDSDQPLSGVRFRRASASSKTDWPDGFKSSDHGVIQKPESQDPPECS
jgi:uncharacterized protein YjbI with pentapeptide repeats